MTVAAADAPLRLRQPDGNDANNGRTTTAAVKTFARAAQLVGDNTEVLFERGSTYIAPNDDDARAQQRRRRRLRHRRQAGPEVDRRRRTTARSSRTHGRRRTSPSATSRSTRRSPRCRKTGYNDGVRIGGKNITVRDCTFLNVGYAINTNGFPEGVLVQDNDCPNLNGLRTYFAWVQGSDHVYLGNKVQGLATSRTSSAWPAPTAC